MNPLVVLGFIGFVLQLIVVIVGGVWGLARLDRSIRAALAEHREEIDNHLASLQREMIERDATLERNVGEVAAAIRQKITEVELFSRDTFLRRASFYEALRATNEAIEKIGVRLEGRFEKLSEEVNDIHRSHGTAKPNR